MILTGNKVNSRYNFSFLIILNKLNGLHHFVFVLIGYSNYQHNQGVDYHIRRNIKNKVYKHTILYKKSIFVIYLQNYEIRYSKKCCRPTGRI